MTQTADTTSASPENTFGQTATDEEREPTLPGLEHERHILDPGFNLTSEFAINTARQAAISGLLVAFPVWLAPAFVMQIDGRRVMTNIVMLTLIGLFVGTAIIALPIIAPAIFLLHREAHRYQEGRFARGSNN